MNGRQMFARAIAGSVLLTAASGAEKATKILPHRWFRSGHDVAKEEQRRELIELSDTAAEHGYTGVLLSTGFAHFKIKDAETLKGLKEVKAACEKRGIEIIPCIPGVGWGAQLYREDRHLIAGAPVKGTPLVVRGGRAIVTEDPAVKIAGGGFEEFDGDTFRGLGTDDPGRRTFVDTRVKRFGRASLRMQDVGDVPRGYQMCRVHMAEKLNAEPHRCYRLSAWVKAEGLKSGDRFGLYAFKPRGGWPPLPLTNLKLGRPTYDWRQVGYLLNSWGYDTIHLYAGMWGARKGDRGKMWIDEWKIEEVGPSLAVRRKGTPVVIRREGTGRPLVEGKDYEIPVDPKPEFGRPWYRGPGIKIISHGPAELKDGDQLRADWYQPVIGPWPHICMSEPKLYEIYREWIAVIHREISPSKYLLSMDEVRGGCTCALCRSRGMTNGEILADCVNRQFDIVRSIDPEADVLVWDDMFCPHRSAKEVEFHVWVPGGFPNSWRTLNRELIIAVWGSWKAKAEDGRRVVEKAIAHFSGLGFRIMGAAYYGDDSTGNTRAWLEAMRKCPRPYGMIYTTWAGRYAFLPAFGDIISGRAR